MAASANPLIGEQLGAAASADLPTFSLAPPSFGSNHLFARSLAASGANAARSAGFNGLANDQVREASGQQNTYLAQSAPGDYLHQGGQVDQSVSWMSQPANANQHTNGLDLQQAVQRVGESLPQQDEQAPVLSGSTKRDMKPVKRSDRKPYSSPASLLNQAVSSLTFFANQPTAGHPESGKLMSVQQQQQQQNYQQADGQQFDLVQPEFKMMSLPGSDGANGGFLSQRMSPNARSDNQVDEKHRYSLVEDSDLAQFNPSNSLEEQQKLSSSPSKPLLLSAMSQAISSMLSGQHQQQQQLRQQQTGALQSSAESGSLPLSSSSAPTTSGQFVSNWLNKLEFVADKATINHLKEPAVSRRQLVATNSNKLAAPEQRELSQLLPQSWREAVKRTMTTVQQQASTQWRSIEGQLTSWVQDKLKSLPTGGAPAGNQAGGASSTAPVANIIASVGSTALNLLGIGNKGTSVLATPLAAAPAHSDASNSDGPKHEASNVSNSPSRSGLVQPAKAALVGVSNMIVNSLTNRQVASATSSSAGAQSTATAAAQKTPADASANVSQYPTITGAQSSQKTASST